MELALIKSPVLLAPAVQDSAEIAVRKTTMAVPVTLVCTVPSVARRSMGTSVAVLPALVALAAK